ncbi:DNA-directed RNA polymerase I subunit rpa49 [Teratosphaeriaceae sp. CCFEE 6253]|nr:DNA-directed RNA polymerase I subunit rpa49 [Teratosphaeriaceae sp. CCFEE 6253]
MAEKEGRKRKRQANGAHTTNKKAVTEGSGLGSSDIKVTYANEDVLRPVLVSAPGLMPPSIPFEPYVKPLATKHAGSAPKPDTHNVLLHSSKHQRVDYTASSSSLGQQQSHYIAIFDPATNELQITPTHHLDLRSVPRKTADLDEDQDATGRGTYAAQREDLGKEFGTKKAQKFIASRTENAIVKDSKGKGKKSDVQDAILESMADASVSATPRKQDADDDLLSSKPIPRPNLMAESVEDVYSFDTLIPPSDARLVPIKDWQDAVQADQAINFNHRYPAFRLNTIGRSDDLLKLKALRYLGCLLEFHDALQSGGRAASKKVPKKEVLQKRIPTDKYPEALVDAVRRRFATPANELPKWQLENLYTHICALSLYIDDWRTDTTNLKDDLKMENKQISQYFVELGAKIGPPTEREREDRNLSKAQASVVKMARLKLPLEFPKARTGRRK